MAALGAAETRALPKTVTNIPDTEFTSSANTAEAAASSRGAGQPNSYVTVDYETSSSDPTRAAATPPARVPALPSSAASKLTTLADRGIAAVAPPPFFSANTVNNQQSRAGSGTITQQSAAANAPNNNQAAPAAGTRVQQPSLAATGKVPAVGRQVPAASRASTQKETDWWMQSESTLRDPSLTALAAPLSASLPQQSSPEAVSTAAGSGIGDSGDVSRTGTGVGSQQSHTPEVADAVGQGGPAEDWVVNITEPQPQGANFKGAAHIAKRQARHYRSLPGTVTAECEQRLLRVVRQVNLLNPPKCASS